MAKHWRDYITHDSGTLGQAAASYQSVHNLSVAEAGKDSFDFVQRAQLSHASVLPLKANGQVIAICVCYSGGPAGPDILACWQAFAELVSIALQEIKSRAEFR